MHENYLGTPEEAQPVKPKGIFITGTDTGVGKTIVAAGIVRALIRNGVKAGAMKPIETGCESIYGMLMPRDGTFLRAAAEMSDSIDLVVPSRFRYPLAPMVASELEERPVALDAIMAAHKELSATYEFLVVEGAGGLLVPVTKRQGIRDKEHEVYFVKDLIKDLRLPVVIVTRPVLGTINHTLLTVEHALREGLEVTGVIINHTAPAGESIAEKTTSETLREVCPVPVIGEMPYCEHAIPAVLESIAVRSVDMSVFRA